MRNSENWELYYTKNRNNPPRDNLVKAIGFFELEDKIGEAIDLGSGAGNDIQFLLDKKWKVYAYDNNLFSEKIIQDRFLNNSNLIFNLIDFKNIDFKSVELINANYALSFCESNYFEELMNKLLKSIKLLGRFSGNFFGEKHSWTELSLVTKNQVEEYFKDFEVEYFFETAEKKISTLGEEMYFHNFDIIAKKVK